VVGVGQLLAPNVLQALAAGLAALEHVAAKQKQLCFSKERYLE